MIFHRLLWAGLCQCTWAMRCSPFSFLNEKHISTENGLCATAAIWTAPKPNPISYFSPFVSKEKVLHGARREDWPSRRESRHLVDSLKVKGVKCGVCSSFSVHYFSVSCRRQTESMWRFNCPHLRIWCVARVRVDWATMELVLAEGIHPDDVCRHLCEHNFVVEAKLFAPLPQPPPPTMTIPICHSANKC